LLAAPAGARLIVAACFAPKERDNGYVTDLAEGPNPYAQLPSYWSAGTSGC
jgi:hypothetical protein